MSAKRALPRIAILGLPEATASVVYGMLDLFCSAGRDWKLVTDGTPGDPVVEAELVAATPEPFEVANGAWLRPHAGLTSKKYDIICVPELAIAPNHSLEGRFLTEMAWLRMQHASGAILATACSGAVLLAAAGLLDGLDATTHWAYCDSIERRYPTSRRSAL